MPGDSLREQLQAAYAEHSDDGQGAASAAVAPVDTGAPTGAEGVEGQAAAAVAAPETKPPVEGAPARDEQGRFAPKTSDGQATAEAPKTGDAPALAPPVSETAKPEGEGARQEPTRVPPSLPAAIKAKFGELPEDVQQAFVGLEDSVQKAKAEWARKGERLNRYEELFSPRREQFAMRGLDEVQVVQMLFAAQDLLDRNPVHGILELARSYGVNLAQVAQQMNGGQPMGQGAQQPGQPQGFDPNALQSHIAQALAPLQQQLQTFQQQTEAEKNASAQAEVSAFTNDPKNIYWHDVKDDVAWLLQNGRAKTLPEAYEQATWSNPTIRPLLVDAQSRAAIDQRAAMERAEAQKLQAAERARSQAAAQAAGSVTGAPQGTQAAALASSTGNLRKDLEAAWQGHTAAV